MTWDDIDLAKLECELFVQVRVWKNIEELENSITFEELIAFLEAQQESKEREMRFLAAIQGVDIDSSNSNEERFDEVQRRVQAKLSGKTPDQLQLESLGINVT